MNNLTVVNLFKLQNPHFLESNRQVNCQQILNYWRVKSSPSYTKCETNLTRITLVALIFADFFEVYPCGSV